MESLLEQATAKNPLADDAWARLAGVKAAFDRDAPALAAAEKAVAMVPGSSSHHRTLALVLARQGRDADARVEAGRAMAMARTPEDRTAAQRTLDDLAKSAAAAEARAKGQEIARLIGACRSSPSACAAALPIIAADCDSGVKGSAVSCSAAGDIVDAGRGVPEGLARAVMLYTKGCDGGDAPACWAWRRCARSGEACPETSRPRCACSSPRVSLVDVRPARGWGRRWCRLAISRTSPRRGRCWRAAVTAGSRLRVSC